MRNNRGQFLKGHHWRPHAIFREKDYLIREYLDKKRSTADIAKEHGVHTNAIAFWLRKHGIPKRTVSEARKVKWWGSFGAENPMHGKTGVRNPNWKGGCTPDRQAFYASAEWRRVAKEVRKRGGGQCQRCKAKGALQIHHLVSFSVIRLRAVLSNLILLCEDCHDWVHSKANKDRSYLADDNQDHSGRCL